MPSALRWKRHPPGRSIQRRLPATSSRHRSAPQRKRSLVTPREHVDHFTDLDDRTSQHLIVVAQKIGRRMRKVLQPQRVGMVVRGFGVPHAHLLLTPKHQPDDMVSGRFARFEWFGNRKFKN